MIIQNICRGIPMLKFVVSYHHLLEALVLTLQKYVIREYLRTRKQGSVKKPLVAGTEHSFLPWHSLRTRARAGSGSYKVHAVFY